MFFAGLYHALYAGWVGAWVRACIRWGHRRVRSEPALLAACVPSRNLNCFACLPVCLLACLPTGLLVCFTFYTNILSQGGSGSPNIPHPRVGQSALPPEFIKNRRNIRSDSHCNLNRSDGLKPKRGGGWGWVVVGPEAVELQLCNFSGDF